MIGLDISIPDGGDANETSDLFPETLPLQENNIYLETAMLALESINGVAVETNTRANAAALRHRFYREIAKAVTAGNASLRSVTISLKKMEGDGWELHLKNLPMKVRAL